MRSRNLENRGIHFLSLMLILGTIILSRLLHASNTSLQQNRREAIEAFAVSPLLPLLPKKQDLVRLADPAVARRLNLTPRQQQEIARIDSQLDKEAHKAMRAAIEAWQKRGGFHAESIPNFRDPISPYGRSLNVMKRAAEEKIAALLSEEEKRRWSEEMGPQPDGGAARLMSATL